MTSAAPERPTPVPVIGLTGYLGAGKTTTLNHLLRQPGARLGVVVNDFGSVNVDAGLISGQVDEVAAITGGCICCLPDSGGLDDALTTLANPRLRLDAVIVEASGIADSLSFSHLLRYSGADNIRYGGVVEILDASEYERGPFSDRRRCDAASLIIVNKLDALTPSRRETLLAEVSTDAARGATTPSLVGAIKGNIDPALLFDVATPHGDSDQLDFAGLFPTSGAHFPHSHAASVWVDAPAASDADALFELLDAPPTGAYRIKGTVALRVSSSTRRYSVNLVNRSIHVAAGARGGQPLGLMAIGERMDQGEARLKMTTALRPAIRSSTTASLRRLRRHLRLSR